MLGVSNVVVVVNDDEQHYLRVVCSRVSGRVTRDTWTVAFTNTYLPSR